MTYLKIYIHTLKQRNAYVDEAPSPASPTPPFVSSKKTTIYSRLLSIYQTGAMTFQPQPSIPSHRLLVATLSTAVRPSVRQHHQWLWCSYSLIWCQQDLLSKAAACFSTTVRLSNDALHQSNIFVHLSDTTVGDFNSIVGWSNVTGLLSKATTSLRLSNETTCLPKALIHRPYIQQCPLLISRHRPSLK